MTADEERRAYTDALRDCPAYWTVSDPATAIRARDAYRVRYPLLRAELVRTWEQLSDEGEAVMAAGLAAMKREAQ